jgi:hypothetical protein
MTKKSFKIIILALIAPMILPIYAKMHGEEVGLFIAVGVYPIFNFIIIGILLLLYFKVKDVGYLFVLFFGELGMVFSYSTETFIGNIIWNKNSYALTILTPIASIPDRIFKVKGFMPEYVSLVSICILAGVFFEILFKLGLKAKKR